MNFVDCSFAPLRLDCVSGKWVEKVSYLFTQSWHFSRILISFFICGQNTTLHSGCGLKPSLKVTTFLLASYESARRNWKISNSIFRPSRMKSVFLFAAIRSLNLFLTFNSDAAKSSSCHEGRRVDTEMCRHNVDQLASWNELCGKLERMLVESVRISTKAHRLEKGMLLWKERKKRKKSHCMQGRERIFGESASQLLTISWFHHSVRWERSIGFMRKVNKSHLLSAVRVKDKGFCEDIFFSYVCVSKTELLFEKWPSLGQTNRRN